MRLPGVGRRIGVGLVGLAVCLALVFGRLPTVRAGYCAGNKAQVQRLVERLTFMAGGILEQARLRGHEVVRDVLVPGARLLACWTLYWKTRTLLGKVVEAEGDFPESRLRDRIGSDWEQAARIHWKDHRSVEAVLDRSLEAARGRWLACRAIDQGSLSPCEGLGDRRPEEIRRCKDLAVNYGILYGHRCEPEHIRIAATYFHESEESAGAYCRLLRDQDPAGCDRIDGLQAESRGVCRALAGEGQAACLGLPAGARDKCRDALMEYRAVRGQRAVVSDAGEFTWLLRALSWRARVGGALDCRAVMLREYDRQAAAFFDLEAAGPFPYPSFR